MPNISLDVKFDLFMEGHLFIILKDVILYNNILFDAEKKILIHKKLFSFLYKDYSFESMSTKYRIQRIEN